MPLSQKERAAISVLLGSQDQGTLAELLNLMVSTTAVEPPQVPRAYETHEELEPSGNKGIEHSTIPVAPAQSATTARDTALFDSRYRLDQPAQDEFVQYTELLSEDGRNCAAWARFSYEVLRSRHLTAIIDGLASKLDPEYDGADNRAYVQLAGNVEMKLLDQIQFTNTFDFWHALQIRFSYKTKSARSCAHTLLRSKRLKDGESMSDHIQALRRLRADGWRSGRRRLARNHFVVDNEH